MARGARRGSGVGTVRQELPPRPFGRTPSWKEGEPGPTKKRRHSAAIRLRQGYGETGRGVTRLWNFKCSVLIL